MYHVTKPRGPWQTAKIARDGSKVRPLVIRIEPECIAIKLKGLRSWYRLPYGVIYNQAAHAEALAKRRAKAEARKQRSRVRRGIFAGGK